jgi:hypothetical protein
MAYVLLMEDKRPLQSIHDDELLRRLAELMGQSRRVEADIVAHIAEVEERGLYAREAFPSMLAYCMTVLHLSEAEAYLRILASRASRKHPLLLTMLADGRLHLTAIVKLAPHLTLANRDVLLERATHRSKRQILELVAEIAPRPDVPAVVRKLPERRIGMATPLAAPDIGDGVVRGLGPDLRLGLGPDLLPGFAQTPPLEHRPDAVAAPESGARPDQAAVGVNIRAVAREASAVPVSLASTPLASLPSVVSRVAPSVVQPLSPGRYKVQFTASAQFHDKLEKLRALMGSRAPDGDLAAIIEEAVTEKLERLEARRFARTKAPRKGLDEHRAGARPDSSPSSRQIPAHVRRAVYERDGGRCRYVDEQGRRCPEQNQLEFHHRHPFGLGGDHTVANLSLMCRAHNAHLAECDYGRKAMASHRQPRNRAPQPVTG